MDANDAPTHPFFDAFMDTRMPGPPSDFDCYLLNAILALPLALVKGDDGQHYHNVAVPLSSPQSLVTASTRPNLDAIRAMDKLFPLPLLKCPMSVFIQFSMCYHLPSHLVEAIRAARRRKTNRKSQRISRNRRTSIEQQQVNLESDEEGECGDINCASVYTQLIAAMCTTTMPTN